MMSVGRINRLIMGTTLSALSGFFAPALLTVLSQGPLLISHLLANLFTLERL